MSGALVELSDIEFGFDDGPPILSDINLEIHSGQVVTLLGASGCGKSTLLNMVAGLLFPRRGICRFGGSEITSVNTEIGYMTQDDTLLPWRTVRANVALPLRLRRTPRVELDRGVSDMIALMKLDHADRHYPAQLSGGMKRRALMARALVYAPRMVLMDEPFAAIDADLREQLHDEVRRMVTSMRQTVLFVTHDIAEAALLSDRVVVLAGQPAASIVDILDVPFGPDRDLQELRSSQEFFDLQVALRGALRHGDTADASSRDAYEERSDVR